MINTMQMKSVAQTMDDDAPNILGTGNVGKLLLQYSLPAIIGTAAQSIYNVIDRVFIGHGVGAMAISGLAVTMPIMNLAAALGAMVGVGSAALVSIRLGEQNKREADSILGNTFVLSLALSISFTILCFLFLDKLLFCMGASPQTLPYAKQFIQVILLGNVFTHVYFGLNNVMRASGYPAKAMVTTLVTVAVNLVLAPLFIFAFHWGIRGAATATVCAQGIGSVWAFLHFTRKEHAVRFRRGCFKPKLRIIRDVVSIGLPSFIMLFCASFVAVLVNTRLTRYGGDYAIGAFGIINVVLSLFVMITVGVNMGMQPIAGFNYGAGKMDRAIHTYKLAVCAATCITTFGFLLGEVFPHAVASAFTSDAELIRQSVKGMRIAVLFYPIVGFQMVTSSFFQSIDKARIAILLSLSRQVVFLIPFLIVLPLIWKLNGVWFAGPASDLTASVVTLVVLRAWLRRRAAE
jgi:putative MATE family efflux protein